MSKSYFGPGEAVDPLDMNALDGLSFSQGGYPGPKRMASTNLFTEAGFTFDLDWEKPLIAQSDPEVLTIPSTTTFQTQSNNDSESVADYIRMVNGGLVNVDRTIRSIKGLPKRPEYEQYDELGLPRQNQDRVSMNERGGTESFDVFNSPAENFRIAGEQGRQSMEAPAPAPVQIEPDYDVEVDPSYNPDYVPPTAPDPQDPRSAQQARDMGLEYYIDSNGKIVRLDGMPVLGQ